QGVVYVIRGRPSQGESAVLKGAPLAPLRFLHAHSSLVASIPATTEPLATWPLAARAQQNQVSRPCLGPQVIIPHGNDLAQGSLRRQFVRQLGGHPLSTTARISSRSGAAAWPLAARAQQTERVRRIGVLMTLAADDLEGQARLRAFVQGLQELGWTDGRNVRLDYRWPAGDAERIRRQAAELVALAPDVILAGGGAVVPSLLQATRTVPIVFTQTPDPVGAGFVDSLARPGGNATGFTLYEYGISPKWLELLKEIAPRVTRAAIVRDATIASGIGQWGAIQTASPSFGVEVSSVNMHDVGQIERVVAAFARSPNGGIIVTGSPMTTFHRDLIVILAARHKLPAIYWTPSFVTSSGLISYGPDLIEQCWRRPATSIAS